MKVNLEVASVDIDMADVLKAVEKFIPGKPYTIFFKGRYAVLREFGTTPIAFDDSLVAEFTNDYMDSGMDNYNAAKTARELMEYLAKNGMRPMPFIRPAVELTLAKYSNKDTPINIMDDMTVEIAELATRLFDLDSKKVEFTIPVQYEIEG